jgi:hypothetical protein
MVSGPFLCHFQDIPVSLLVLPVESMILLFQALSFLGHFFHLLAEGKEEIVAVVQSVLDLMVFVSDLGMRGVMGTLLYLFELLHVDVELASQFGFGMRESGNLGGQSSASVGFNFTSAALLLELGGEALDLRILAT